MIKRCIELDNPSPINPYDCCSEIAKSVLSGNIINAKESLK